jgi:prephenate dehydrogenase
LWSEILLANSLCLLPLLADAEHSLAQVRALLASRDDAGLQDWLQTAKTLRDDWERTQQRDTGPQGNPEQ